MEIKDLIGLSKPLTRLVEVLSQGVGAVARPYLIKRDAVAKAEAIKTISDALGEVAEKHGLPVVFKEDGIEIWQRPEDRTLRLDLVPMKDRTECRLEFQERKRQHNIESISAAAAIELQGVESVPENTPDEDWISRFFASAQDVSSEQMQELWGRILAGEIQRPGSFSLRTLDFVRNLTKEHAALLERIVNLAFIHGDTAVVPVFDKDWLERERQIYPVHHFTLSELGALYPSDLGFRQFLTEDAKNAVLLSGNFVLMLEKQPPVGEVLINIWKFTQVGREVISLINPDGDKNFVEQVGRHYAQNGVKVHMADIIERLGDGRVRYQNSVELSGEG